MDEKVWNMSEALKVVIGQYEEGLVSGAELVAQVAVVCSDDLVTWADQELQKEFGDPRK